MFRQAVFWSVIVLLSGFQLQTTKAQVILGSGVGKSREKQLHFRQIPAAESAEPWNYDVTSLRFDLNIDPAIDEISGSVLTAFVLTGDPAPGIRMELSTDFTVDSVLCNGRRALFVHDGDFDLRIALPAGIQEGEHATAEVFYHGVPPTDLGFGAVGRHLHQGVPAFWTLSEPFGCRDWWPGKNDLTDKADSVDMVVHSPELYRAASNGILAGEQVSGGIRTCHWKHRYPVAPYLIAVAVTNYETYSETAIVNGKPVQILNYVYPENKSTAIRQTEVTAELVELFSEFFGPYPFAAEKYGHAQFGWGGGMEHQTMSFMGRFDYEIIAHELAHQWFGDAVTLNSWKDVWLNEGFATYLAGMSYEHLFDGYWWPRWKTLAIDYVTSEPGGTVYCPDTANVNRLFDSRLTYYKASLLLHMLRHIMGDEAFYQACRNYLNDPRLRFGYAGTADLKAHLEAVHGSDLSWFFDDWLYGEGYPSWHVKCTALGNYEYEAVLIQRQSHPSVSFFEMLVPVRFKGAKGDTTLVFHHTENGQRWKIQPGFRIDSVVVDPEQWLITKGNSYQIIDDTDEIKIYPNPAGSWLRVELNYSPEKIGLFDVKGRKIDVRYIIDNPGIKFDIEHLASGVYFIEIEISGKKTGSRFVKQ